MRVRKVKSVAFFASIVALAGCASPTVVQERQAGDGTLSCTELVGAIQEANDFERNARDERGATGTNVAAAVFFWPGLIATYANTDDAIQAAQERQRYLNRLYEEKNCDSTTQRPVVAAPAPQQVGTTYTADAVVGAPAYMAPDESSERLHTFASGADLTVLNVLSDGVWLRVLLPDGSSGFVPKASVNAPEG